MYFCDKCSSILDITKIINNPYINKINSPKEFIENIINDDIYGVNEIEFNEKSLLNNSNFNNLNIDNKNDIINIFHYLKSSNISYFICYNCNNHKPLFPNTIIFKSSINNNNLKNNNKIKLKDKTLPRTKDYICPNTSCNSHNNNLQKEAIFYRPIINQYLLHYICCVCNTEWKA